MLAGDLFKITKTFSFKIVYCETCFRQQRKRKYKSQIQCPNFRADWKLGDRSGGLQPQCSSSVLRAQGRGGFESPPYSAMNSHPHPPPCRGRGADDFIDIWGFGTFLFGLNEKGLYWISRFQPLVLKHLLPIHT